MRNSPSAMSALPSDAAKASARNDWGWLRIAAPALLLGLALLGVVFFQEAAAAVSVWSSSTAYNHCFLVLPIAVWLAYDRRRSLSGGSLEPSVGTTLGAVPLMATWFVSERLGIMEGRQLVAIVIVMVLFLSVLGWRLAWLLSASLFYLVFLVPFGGFLTGTLQDFTAGFIVRGLDILGIANISNGNTIEIPEGVFFVAEACAGLRFLIASIAFGVLYSVTFYRTSGRRAAFIVASVIVPVVANGLRALGIVVAGHWVGSAEAAAADHVIYGWLFFSTVTLMLIVAGLPFRQDQPPHFRPVGLRHSSNVTSLSPVVPAVLLVIIAAAGPLLARQLDHEISSNPVAFLPTITGCTAMKSGGWPDLGLGSSVRSQRYLCDQGAIILMVAALPPRTNPMVVLSLRRRLEGDAEAEDQDVARVPDAPDWQLVSSTHPPHVVATALWVNGKPSSAGLRSRIQQALGGLAGANNPPVVAAVRSAVSGAIVQQRNTILNYLIDADHDGPKMSAELATFSSTEIAPNEAPTSH